jgi:hypothetical protein
MTAAPSARKLSRRALLTNLRIWHDVIERTPSHHEQNPAQRLDKVELIRKCQILFRGHRNNKLVYSAGSSFTKLVERYVRRFVCDLDVNVRRPDDDNDDPRASCVVASTDFHIHASSHSSTIGIAIVIHFSFDSTMIFRPITFISFCLFTAGRRHVVVVAQEDDKDNKIIGGTPVPASKYPFYCVSAEGFCGCA